MIVLINGKNNPMPNISKIVDNKKKNTSKWNLYCSFVSNIL